MSSGEVRVDVFDTTLRDGAQALPMEHQFRVGAKPEIAGIIAKLGAAVIEAGFPATPGDREEVEEVASTVGRTGYESSIWVSGERTGSSSKSPVITGLSRATMGDIEATWSAVEVAKSPRIHTFVSTDPEHMSKKFPGKSPEQVLAMGSRAVRYASELAAGHPSATVEFSAEAASTTDNDYLERVVKAALEAGADIINVPDTVGQRDPMWMYDYYGRVIDWVMKTNPDATISAHNHNDLGLAVANTGMLVRAAADYAATHDQRVQIQLETTVCGLGERAGNADAFSVVAGLHKFTPDMAVPVRWEFNPGESVASANAVMSHAGYAVPRQSPIVGSDTNKHRSGIHSDGVVKGGYGVYSPFDPQFWGHRDQYVIEDGKYQGKHGREAARS